MTVVEIPSGAHMAERWLGGRFRLDERISLDDQVSGPCGSSWEARGLSLWKATDQLLSRPVTIYLLPDGTRPARRDRRGAGRRQGIRPAARHHLRHRLRRAVPVHRGRVDARHAPGGPGAVRAFPARTAAGPGRRDDRGRGRRYRGRAPGRPAAPAADPALGALAPGLRPQDHRPGPGRGPVRHTSRQSVAPRRRTRWRPTPRRWPGCCTRCSPGTGPATSPPRCRPRPGTRDRCARRARCAPGCLPCWTPSPTAGCRARRPTPRCGRRPRPGWPWRSAWCSGRPTSWGRWRPGRASGPGAQRRQARHARARAGFRQRTTLLRPAV